MTLAVLVVATMLLLLTLFEKESVVYKTDPEQLLFSNEAKQLPLAVPTTWEVGQERYEGQVAEYGDLAVRFWADGSSISFVKEFDVTDDDVAERIVGLCDIWGNHCPHEIIIIQDDRQIFSTTAGLAYKDIVEVEAEDGNGFYLLWDSEEMRVNGLAQPLGHIKTHFAYKDGQFQPVFSEEVIY